MTRGVVLGIVGGISILVLVGADPVRMRGASGPADVLDLPRHLGGGDAGRAVPGGPRPHPGANQARPRRQGLRDDPCDDAPLAGPVGGRGAGCRPLPLERRGTARRAGDRDAGDGHRAGGPGLGRVGQSLLLVGDPGPRPIEGITSSRADPIATSGTRATRPACSSSREVACGSAPGWRP